MKPVDSFVLAVRRRLNKNRACSAILWAVLAGGAVLLMIALTYVNRDYEVPRYWYGIAAGATALGGLVGALTHRATVAEAAEYADAFFGIKDTIVSNRRFEAEHKAGGYYDLQAGQTASVIQPLDAKRVPFVWPQQLGACAAVLVMGCLLTAFKSTDPEILKRIEIQRITQARFDELKKALGDEADKLEKSTTDDEEKKLLGADDIKEMVKKLESTKELAEALKQLAKLEKKLDDAAKALSAKREEQLLKKVAEELEKEEDPQARELAKKLKNEQFKEAAKDLEKMKPENLSDVKEKKLSDKRKEAARLKAMAQRMATAARQQKGNLNRLDKNAQSKIKKSDKNDPGKENGDKDQDSDKDPVLDPDAEDTKFMDPDSKDPKFMKPDSSKGSKSGDQDEEEADDADELAEDLEELKMEADEYDEDLEELEEGEKLGKIDISKLKKSDEDGEKLRARLKGMSGKLNKLGMKSDARKKLRSMSKKAGQGQSFMQGLAQSPSNAAGKGGLKPGNGTVDISRDQKDELKDNGNTTQLKGQKGTGPSITKIEAADDGTGTSHRKGEAKERAFKKQFESFVQREDVPEDVKDGVKHYFESLHEAEPQAGEAKPAEGK